MSDAPITTEPTSAAQTAAVSLARHAITAVGAYAIAKGWLDQATLNQIIALGAVVLPAAFSVWKSYQTAKALKAAAPLVPNSIIGSK